MPNVILHWSSVDRVVYGCPTVVGSGCWLVEQTWDFASYEVVGLPAAVAMHEDKGIATLVVLQKRDAAEANLFGPKSRCT